VLKKQLVKEGKLDKYGRPNENTPKDWTEAPDLSSSSTKDEKKRTAEEAGISKDGENEKKKKKREEKS